MTQRKDQAEFQGNFSEEESSLDALRQSIEAGNVAGSEDESEEQPETKEENPETTDSSAKSEDEEQPEVKEEEWIVPGQFKTKEDLVNSYKHLQADYTKKTSELSRLKQLEAGKSTPAPAETDPNAEVAEFAGKIAKNPVGAIRDLAAEQARQIYEAQNAIKAREQIFVNRYNQLRQDKEFVELEPVMSQIAEEMEGLVDEKNASDPRILDLLFTAAKQRKMAATIAEEKKKSEIKGEQKGLKKARLSVEGGSSTKGRTTKSADDMELEELEAEIKAGNLGD